MEQQFKSCRTVNEVKSLFRKLALRYHPDRGGTHDEFILLNDLYHKYLKTYDGAEYSSNGTNYQYHYNEAAESDVAEKIYQALKIDGDIVVELIGSWVWVTGETKAVKEELKELAFKFAPQKQAWYWHAGKYRKKSKNNYDLEEIREKYGAEKYEKRRADKIA